MIDLNRISVGDEVIIRLPNGKKVLGEVTEDEVGRFVKTPEGANIYFAERINHKWQALGTTVIGHIPSMFGGDW